MTRAQSTGAKHSVSYRNTDIAGFFRQAEYMVPGRNTVKDRLFVLSFEIYIYIYI